jgi:hypothetical protein
MNRRTQREAHSRASPREMPSGVLTVTVSDERSGAFFDSPNHTRRPSS